MNRKKYRYILALICTAVLAAGCGSEGKAPDAGASNSGITGDAETAVSAGGQTGEAPVKTWFPNLQGIESVIWEAEIADETDSVVPGPGDYEYRGFIVLDDISATSYMKNYNWEEVKPNFETKQVDASRYENDFWYESQDFSQAVLDQNYSGKIIFNGKAVFFDIIRN